MYILLHYQLIMPGNENEVIKFLFNNRENLDLSHIGKIDKIEIPKKDKLIEINYVEEIEKNSSSDSSKKADVFLNSHGISIKENGSKLYNKFYRRDLNFINKFINDKKTTKIVIKKIENKLKQIHTKSLKRDVMWSDLIEKKYFKPMLKYLMMDGKPFKKNKFPADYILESSKNITTASDLSLYSFEEYFKKNYNYITFAFRRVWYGMTSSEHKRAKNICFHHEDSSNWCFKSIVSAPRKRKDGKSIWRDEIKKKDRRTAYYLDISQKKNEI